MIVDKFLGPFMVHPYENDLITVLTEIHDEVQYADDCLIFSTGTELSKTLIDLQKTYKYKESLQHPSAQLKCQQN